MTYKTPIERIMEKGYPMFSGMDEITVKKIFDFIFVYLNAKIRMIDHNITDPITIGKMESNLDILDALMTLCARCGYNGGNDGHQIQHDLADINELRAEIKNWKEVLLAKID